MVHKVNQVQINYMKFFPIKQKTHKQMWVICLWVISRDQKSQILAYFYFHKKLLFRKPALYWLIQL